MKSHVRFSQGFGIFLFNAALTVILICLLLPYGVPRVLGANNQNIPHVSKIIETQTVTVNSENETELSTNDGKIKLKIYKGTVDEAMEFTLSKYLLPNSTGMKMLNYFEISAKEHNTDTRVNQFNKEMEITIQHTPEELAGLDTDSLYLYYLDEKKGNWIPIPCEFDRKTLILTAKVNHFSYFGEQANPLQSGPGRVMASQVGLSSGTAIYSYPFELPPGPGGFTQSITLNYNSGSVDGMKNKRDVGSWVGIGWSLNFGKVSYNEGREEYFLDLNGTSYKLISDNETIFYTQPEEFLNITKSDNTWSVYDKSGNYYRFGGTTDSQQYNDGSSYYRWDLSYWKDTNNNEATVTYVQDIWGASVRSAYPEYLRYNNNLVEVHFLSSYYENGSDGPIRKDNPISYGTNPVPKNMENRQLDSIQIKVSGNLTRQYNFTYTTTDRVYSSDYDGIYYSGKHMLTSITQIGADGTSSLPATSFTYEDKQVFRRTDEPGYSGNPGNPASIIWPFLTVIDSGYGGNVTFTYTQIPDNTCYYIWTRQAVTVKTINSGIGSIETYSYTYTGNPAYSGSGWDQEFRGWNEVNETDAAGNSIKHYFYTIGTIDGKSSDHLKGKEYCTKWYQAGSPTTPVKQINYDWLWETAEPQLEGPYLGAKSGGSIPYPVGTAVAPDGSVYIATSGSVNRIVKFDSDLAYTPSPFDTIEIPSPRGLTIDSQGYIYVTCNPRVVRKYSSDGTLILQFYAIDTLGDYNVGQPADIVVSDSGDIFVYQYFQHSGEGASGPGICKYDSNGGFTNQYFYFQNSPGGLYGFLYSINDIKYSPDGHIYACVLYLKWAYGQYVVTDYLYKFNQSVQCAGYESIGSRNTPMSLGISENSNIYISFSDLPNVKNHTTGKWFSSILEILDIAVGENSIYVVTNDDAISHTRTNWIVKLNKVEEITNGTKTTRTEYVYDSYGNTITQKNHGDISTLDDDSTIHRVFYPNITANILNKPAEERVYTTITDDIGGANLKQETHYYYDYNNSSLTNPPTQGNLTRLERKIDASNSVSSYNTYDSYGNLLTSQDPNGNVTTWTFDTTYHVYPVTKTMPLVGAESYIYAPGTTNLLSMTDINGQTTAYEYDTFQRLVKVIKPGDSSVSPSVEYQYNNWGTIFYQNIKTITKADASTFLWQTQYFDGLGRAVQVHANGESGHTIISSTTSFNNRGLVDKQYVSQDIASILTSYQSPDAGWKYSTSTYDALGRVIVQTGADGTFVSHYYGVAWQDTVTNQRGFRTRFFYDAYQHLVKVEEQDTEYQIYAATTYQYDVLGNLLQVVDNNSNTTLMSYDWLSRKTVMSDPDMGLWTYTYDNNGNLVSQTDAKSQIITMNYDALNRLIARIYPVEAGMTNVCYGYDSTGGGNYGKGQRTSMTDAAGTVTYMYDCRGRMIQENRIIDSVSYITSFTYDGADRPVTTAYPTGEIVTQIYNGRGLPYSLSGNVAGSLVTGTEYNSLGMITEINIGNGLRTTFGYYDTGGAYDASGGYFGKLWEIKTLPQAGGDALQDIRHSWDAGGNLVQRDDMLTSTTEYFTYDFLDRLISAGSEGGGGTPPEPPPEDWLAGWENRVEITVDSSKIDDNLTFFPVLVHIGNDCGKDGQDLSFIFDEVGANYHKIAVTIYDGETQLYIEVEKWDAAGEEAWLWASKSGWTVSASEDTTLYLYYDGSHEDNSGYVDIPGGDVSQNVWDSYFGFVNHLADTGDHNSVLDSTANNNDCIKVTPNDPTEANGLVGEAQNFDGSNDICHKDTGVASIGGQTQLTIEAIIKRVGTYAYQTIYGLGNPATCKTHTLMFHTNRIMVQLGNNEGTALCRYVTNDTLTDTANWHHIVATYNAGTMHIYVDGVEWAGTYIYNYSGVAVAPTIYLGLGMTCSNGYWTNPFTGFIDEVRISNYARSLAWVKASYHNVNDNLISFSDVQSLSKNSLEKIIGSILKKVLPVPELMTGILMGLAFGITRDGGSSPYEETYTYNEIGNIMSRNGIAYTYASRPHAVTSVGSMNYTYDANGNMITRGGQTLTWDAENRLIAVSGNGTAASFVYDGDGNRVKKIENGETTIYVTLYYEKNLTTGNVTSSYYLGGRLVAAKENDVLRYVHQDHLTGTSLMTDSSGSQIDETVKYLPFGETFSGNVPTDKKFTGQRLDATGLYYYGARYYDTTIGRFISPDIIIQKPANPQSINRYSYTLNNPLRYIDPTGHFVELGGDEQLISAWELFASYYSEIADTLMESPIIFVFRWGEAKLAYTQVIKLNDNNEAMIVDVVFNMDAINPGREGIEGLSYVMAHEIVHCINYAVNPQGDSATLYEEVIAMQFQYSYGKQIDYEPVSRWYEPLWNWFMGGTSMQEAQQVVERAMNVDLTGEPSSTLNRQLIDAFSGSTYMNSGYRLYLLSPDYWADMGRLVNIFIK